MSNDHVQNIHVYKHVRTQNSCNPFSVAGIANSLDFTDRFLPRLQTHLHHCQPQLLQFRPYTKDEIASILFHRLGDTGVIDPKAIEFCARKVSAVFGDLRKALDLCR